MNIFLWVLQVVLALHTAIGAVWKFSHSAEQTMPSLGAIPHDLWLALAVFELICSVDLILPAFQKRLAILAPIAAAGIALEMLVFSGLHIGSGDTNRGPVVYWLVVAGLSGLLGYFRWAHWSCETPRTE